MTPSERHKGDIIKLIQLAIESFNDSYKKVDGTVNWRTNVDEDLAKHLLIMFEKTKHINVRQMNQDQFERLWTQYSVGEEYCMQILNYIVNSDDYVLGDRFKLHGDITIRKSNYFMNAVRRFGAFEEDPQAKRLYYGKLMAIAAELSSFIIN